MNRPCWIVKQPCWIVELPFDASWSMIVLALAGAFCLGVSKAGFPGLAIVNVVLIVMLFGARNSTGIILPLLILCDFIVYPLFRKFASWRAVWRFLPVTMVGVVLGYFLLKEIDEARARQVIGGIILVMLGLQLLREFRKSFLENLPDSKLFLHGSGFLIGVSTALANAAGPVYSIYALVHRMTKEDFLGIGARLFLLVNLLKVPFLAGVVPGLAGREMELINRDSLTLNLMLVPGILAGIFLGKFLIGRVPQRLFEILLYGFSMVAGVKLLFF